MMPAYCDPMIDSREGFIPSDEAEYTMNDWADWDYAAYEEAHYEADLELYNALVEYEASL